MAACTANRLVLLLFFALVSFPGIFATHVPGHIEFDSFDAMLNHRVGDNQYAFKTLKGFPNVVFVDMGANAQQYYFNDSFYEGQQGGFTTYPIRPEILPKKSDKYWSEQISKGRMSEGQFNNFLELIKQAKPVTDSALIFIDPKDQRLYDWFAYKNQINPSVESVRRLILRHELAHSFYSTNDDFRKLAINAWKKSFVDETDMKKFLDIYMAKSGGDIKPEYTENELERILDEPTARLFEQGKASAATFVGLDSSNIQNAFNMGEFGSLPSEKTFDSFSSSKAPTSVAKLPTPPTTTLPEAIPPSAPAPALPESRGPTITGKPEQAAQSQSSQSVPVAPIQKQVSVQEFVDECSSAEKILACISALDKAFLKQLIGSSEQNGGYKTGNEGLYEFPENTSVDSFNSEVSKLAENNNGYAVVSFICPECISDGTAATDEKVKQLQSDFDSLSGSYGGKAGFATISPGKSLDVLTEYKIDNTQPSFIVFRRQADGSLKQAGKQLGFLDREQLDNFIKLSTGVN